jgi:hypothetical protein
MTKQLEKKRKVAELEDEDSHLLSSETSEADSNKSLRTERLVAENRQDMEEKVKKLEETLNKVSKQGRNALFLAKFSYALLHEKCSHSSLDRIKQKIKPIELLTSNVFDAHEDDEDEFKDAMT